VIRSIVEIKLAILIQDIQVVIEANISQWKVERYRTNVPFYNACSKERDSHREVILILKLAYHINLSGKLFFS